MTQSGCGPAPAKAGVLLRHAKLDNTAFYTKVATRRVCTVTSPLDKFGMFTAGEIAPTG
jgi:integrase/recombinase XerD